MLRAHQDLENRRPVWNALSTLFVDNEFGDAEIARMVRVLSSSPYSLPEIEAIYETEVCPVLFHNLIDPAGNWTGWPVDWLEQQILQYLENP